MEPSYSEMMDAHRERRREHLLLAAADVMDARGLRQATMDQVAEGAGVSKIVLYRYFKSKDALVHAVLDDVVDGILDADAAEPTMWWADRMRLTLKVARTRGSAMRLLIRHASHDPVFGRHFERLTAALIARIEDRQVEILGPSDSVAGKIGVLDASIAAFMLDAYVRWIDSGTREEDERFLTWLGQSVRAMVYYWRGLTP
ncbi:MAG: TetR/AcrR family transcriptional regulator [Sphingomonas sp.]|nr:TetR/AcrR family transcriptional regulator [Sphingomonas sp.]